MKRRAPRPVPGALYAAAIARQLADAGHQRAAWHEQPWNPGGVGWSPGFNAEQAGEQVLVYCQGPLGQVDPAAQARQLEAYTLTLHNLGYLVTPEPRPTDEGGGSGPSRVKLRVSRAPVSERLSGAALVRQVAAADAPAAPEGSAAYLVVGDSSTTCSYCGMGAFPSQDTHVELAGYGARGRRGCGARFTGITTAYRLDVGWRSQLAEMRPDLPVIEYAGNAGGARP